MKKFRLAVLAAVVCTAALLTSCIKEESYKVSTAYLDVTLSTRATSTQQQGDGITDVMLWAFKCSIDPNTKLPNSVESKASGWRTVTGLNTFETTGPIHLPLPICGDGTSEEASQNYVIVAVINKGQFGRIIDRTAQQETVDGVTRYPTLALNANTTYSQLINASFDASQQEWWQKYVYDDVTTKTPTHMPVSHWATVNVSNGDKHPNCAEVKLDVFRAVAKAQLFMTKASEFDLEVVEAKLSYNQMPVEGVLLSGLTAESLKTDAPTPAWLGTTVPREENWGNPSPLKNENGGIFKPEEGDTNIQNSVTVTCVGSGSYQFVGSTFMHESTEVCEQTSPTFDLGSVTTDKGYYLEIAYKINNGDEIHKLVAIPYAVVRNHDYQIKATVKNDGGVVVDYTVANWEKVEWDLAFDAAQNSELLPKPDDNSTPTAPAEVSYTQGTEEGAAVFFFKMDGPDGITWKPAILNASQDHYITRVYEVIPKTTDTGGNILTYELSSTPIVGDIEAERDKYYCIKVIALDADAHANRTEPIELGVTHAPQWNEEKSNLLVVNPKTEKNYFWPGKDANGNATNTIGDELRVYIYPKH